MQHFLELQKKLQQQMKYHVSKIENIRLNILGIITEASETLNESNWKPWKQSSSLHEKEFKEELIDILFFWLNLALIMRMSAKEIQELYDEKFLINMKRQEKGY